METYKLLKNEDLDEKRSLQFVFRWIGISQIVLAGFIIGLTIALIVARSSTYYFLLNLGSGIWCSFFIFPPAILSLIASKRITPCLLSWAFTSSMLSVLFMLIAFALSVADGIQCFRWHREGEGVLDIAICCFIVPQVLMALHLIKTYGKLICCSKYNVRTSDMCEAFDCFEGFYIYPYTGMVKKI